MVCFSFQAPTPREIAAQRRNETIRARHNGHVHLPHEFDRRIQNTPWTKKELGGTVSVYETYAVSNRAIRGTTCQVETIRGI